MERSHHNVSDTASHGLLTKKSDLLRRNCLQSIVDILAGHVFIGCNLYDYDLLYALSSWNIYSFLDRFENAYIDTLDLYQQGCFYRCNQTKDKIQRTLVITNGRLRSRTVGCVEVQRLQVEYRPLRISWTHASFQEAHGDKDPIRSIEQKENIENMARLVTGKESLQFCSNSVIS